MRVVQVYFQIVQAGLGKSIEISHALRRLKQKTPGMVVFCAPDQFNPFSLVAAFHPPIGFVISPIRGKIRGSPGLVFVQTFCLDFVGI